MRTRGLSLRFCLLGFCLLLSACSGFQHKTNKRPLRVVSEPPGAVVSVADQRGKRSLGPAPVTTDVEVTTVTHDFNPWQILVPLVSCGGAAAMTALAVDSGGVNKDDLGIVMWSTGAILAGLTCLGAVPATIASAAADGEVAREYFEHGPMVVDAELAGHTDASLNLARADQLTKDPLRFDLHPTGATPNRPDEAISNVLGVIGSAGQVLGGLGLAGQAGPRPVIAVFQVSDRDKSANAKLLDQLTDYLATRLAETGRYRDVPRDELRRALNEQKKGTYDACVDESCQIELGKAVAAELSLSTKLLRVGESCAISATIYDVKIEATTSAASVRTPCDSKKLLDAIDALVEKLNP